MCSGKQKRAAILARRRERRAQAFLAARTPSAPMPPRPCGSAPVDKLLLAPSNSYGEPAFATRGYYVDVHFTCRDCGSQEVWTAAQQKWWYEVAKGYVYSTAARCLACRRQRRSGRMNNNQCNAIKAS
ncbi:zinc-ribbon domain-containing protein [Ralstonia solanacearum]|uniref:zinc-ribbon domain-containing protein n=1 Tax=Ralstonia solanacearum TaxID=305 RepID=UPI000F6146A3|nr:zinc-ribbon domain-containing protein [Ralstonia solanacearum]MCL9843278.1 zinc-ribbon domain-containing protein [Ralstonia solanacearum]MDC6254071.1 zinc-ribbon domain-containing protein [Ralstonia solanacearum]MDC6258826.1 zinc-ribbon domain-containing protein [Ralstonia solanacearum]MDC6302287.1 zinc-ribbon domain-containing protein [Ralstonia solanacearum]